MKILSVGQIRQADAYTIENEPIRSIDLMERASRTISDWIVSHADGKSRIVIFAGMGNNGGDGLAVARHLIDKGFAVRVFVVRVGENMSSDCATNYERVKSMAPACLSDIRCADDFPSIERTDIVVDAVFGSGLNRRLEGLAEELIKYLNTREAVKVAIDIPSGLFADKPMENKAVAFGAGYTLTFQFPKLSFFFAESDSYVGQWEVMDIGLHKDFIENVDTPYFFTLSGMVKPMLHKRPKFSHKGNYGHALLVAGSAGKTGAAILAARSAMRTGVGLLTVHLPQSAVLPLQVSLPEAMVSVDSCDTCLTKLPDIQAYNAIGIGPGLGQDERTMLAVKNLIQNVQSPMVMDADALNILSKNPTWIPFLPQGTILTPHPKEFERLVGKSNNSFERLAKLRSFAVKNRIIVVLKGAHTIVAFPNGNCFFNSTGNAGMATAGSGDVLTGVILSLLAQGYTAPEAAVLGVYLHGLAGDVAKEKFGEDGLLAGDIADGLCTAVRMLRE